MAKQRTNPRSSLQVMHNIPCTQAEAISDIHERIGKIEHTINGNGDGLPGMKGNLLLIKQSTDLIGKQIDELTNKFSAKSEIDDTIELNRLVDVGVKDALEKQSTKKIKTILTVKEFIIAGAIFINIAITLFFVLKEKL